MQYTWKVRFAYLKVTRLKLKVGDAWIQLILISLSDSLPSTAVYLYYGV